MIDISLLLKWFPENAINVNKKKEKIKQTIGGVLNDKFCSSLESKKKKKWNNL